MTEQDKTAEAWAELLAQPYSVENQSKIAKLLNPGKDAWEQVATEEHFENGLTMLCAVRLKIIDKPMTLARTYATAVLSKICLTATSIEALYRNHEAGTLPTLDHSSIAILCRTIIEAGIMYWYLTEEVSEEEWKFRLQVLKIHDAAARVRFWKPLMPDEVDKERAALKQLREELKALPPLERYAEQAQNKLAGGQTVYVDGMRAVVRAMNIDEEYYDGIYNYLSAQAHASPISYFRDSDDPATQVVWSRGFSQYCLHHARQMILRVALRQIKLSGLEKEFDADELGRCRKLIGPELEASEKLQLKKT